ncbi:PREDICTED: hemocyte protein-glutamine gamma-glutamyltransferase-like [Nicrophorus vespilloides]|uniref:Hemocyte protein-glutamine gamma-glutamyltransferase-like n=1 Tax=Nicrophorus vespilloides TaxID=110193 RepID=A0ABM1N5R7_NICVS|nr:PREDICTED: hemocyte protein-glutamine gamma-glutamyltransferase-like [Nicrophorus vespilloides]
MEPLEVEMTEFYPRDNARESRTEEYELVNNPDVATPVFRRGCNVVFAVRFTRDYDEEQDVVRISFGFGEKPHVLQGTRAILPVFPNKKTLNNKNLDRWEMCLNQQYGNTLMLTLRIPANVPVGIWHCSVQTNIKGDRTRRQDHQVVEDIYILFNPWCREDGVFMESEDELKEYIMNETGKIWCGTFKNPKGKKWIFGQFDDVVLPASVFLLEKAGIPVTDRASPVAVSRAISAIINSVDDSGLLEGRWDGQYEDGTSPHAWTGSTAILDLYLATGGQPIKYGQCWVFSAATVTVCRALGIPCRSTTNYVSAHDTNCSLTVDKYFDLFGNKIEEGPDGANDSCWNFHVWNDVWMTRPDLPAGYGGWQVIDATPQEASGGIFRCGPASVEAVRRGEVGYMFDTPFVFAEVNADVCHFQEDEESDWGFSRTSVNQYHVGRRIITKAIDVNDDDGDSDLLDITRSFKNPEGTEAERLAVYNAVKGVPKAQQFYEMPNKEDEDVFFDLVDIESVPFGENFDLVVNIRNESEETRNISAILSAFSVYYTGATAKPIKRAQGVFAVKAGETEVLRVHVKREEYLDKLVDHSLIKIYSIANVKETRQTWSEEDDFTLTKPTLNIDHDSPFIVGMESCVRFSFRNPLEDMPLTECTVTVEGPGLSKPKTISKPDVGPSEVVEFSEFFTPKRLGQRSIVANFNSKEIQGINGCATVAIE